MIRERIFLSHRRDFRFFNRFLTTHSRFITYIVVCDVYILGQPFVTFVFFSVAQLFCERKYVFFYVPLVFHASHNSELIFRAQMIRRKEFLKIHRVQYNIYDVSWLSRVYWPEKMNSLHLEVSDPGSILLLLQDLADLPCTLVQQKLNKYVSHWSVDSFKLNITLML